MTLLTELFDLDLDQAIDQLNCHADQLVKFRPTPRLICDDRFGHRLSEDTQACVSPLFRGTDGEPLVVLNHRYEAPQHLRMPVLVALFIHELSHIEDRPAAFKLEFVTDAETENRIDTALMNCTPRINRQFHEDSFLRHCERVWHRAVNIGLNICPSLIDRRLSHLDLRID